MTAGPADQQDMDIGRRGRLGELAGDAGTQVLPVERGASPGTRHVEQEKPAVAHGAGLKRLPAHPCRVSAAH
jgi:hypothetical protein